MSYIRTCTPHEGSQGNAGPRTAAQQSCRPSCPRHRRCHLTACGRHWPQLHQQFPQHRPCEYLQSPPDDLMKIPTFRKKLEKENASIDIRLKSRVKEQLSVPSNSLRKLFSTRDKVQAVRDEMVVIDRACSNPQNLVSTSDQISRVRHL